MAHTPASMSIRNMLVRQHSVYCKHITTPVTASAVVIPLARISIIRSSKRQDAPALRLVSRSFRRSEQGLYSPLLHEHERGAARHMLDTLYWSRMERDVAGCRECECVFDIWPKIIEGVFTVDVHLWAPQTSKQVTNGAVDSNATLDYERWIFSKNVRVRCHSSSDPGSIVRIPGIAF